jgi:Beta-lactamase superfamily domain
VISDLLAGLVLNTGNNPDILEKNAKAKGIDLSKLDFVVMSHRHGDHLGGMTYLLRVNPRVKIYAPKEGFGVYGSDLPSSFYRKDASLAPDQRYYDGSPPEVMRFGSAWPGANFELVDKNTEIAPNIYLIALLSDKPEPWNCGSYRWPTIRLRAWRSWWDVPIQGSTRSLPRRRPSIRASTSLLEGSTWLWRAIRT